jgi:hypothetical protein
MINTLKEAVIQTKLGRLICRQIILSIRKLSPSRLTYLLLLSNRTHQSRLITLLITKHGSLTRRLFPILENSIKNPTFLFNLATTYKLQKEHDKAFKLFLQLLLEQNESKQVKFIVKALQTERELKEKKLLQYVNTGKLTLSKKATHFLTCEYTLHTDDIIPDWGEIIYLLKTDFDCTLAIFFMLAALGHQKIEYIDKTRDLLISNKNKIREVLFERAMTIVATSYYRSGEKNKLKRLDKQFDFNSLNWKLYMSFGHGHILKAMRYRGMAIKESFLRFYPIQKKLSKQCVLVPEKDICGEAFNSLFYPELHKNLGDFTVICDRRLHTILQRTFPYVNFVAKTPRYMQKSLPNNFNKLNSYLRDFMDHDSFSQTQGAEFFNIDYETLYDQQNTRKGRSEGWLKTDERLKKYWKKALGNDMKLIGVSANSTLRSRIRDMHMIGMEHWGEIFKLPNCKFINLNSSLTEEDIQEYAEKYNVEFITPDIDLFNDFDNLLAIMSILDFAIVPANNMMDFSAALGINAIVFSPSNIMNTWTIEKDAYIFSDKVKFIFPHEENKTIEKMVSEGAAFIKDTISL